MKKIEIIQFIGEVRRSNFIIYAILTMFPETKFIFVHKK